MVELIKNILKKIKEPSLVLNVTADQIIIISSNSAFTRLSGYAEQQLIGTELLNVTAYAQIGDPQKLKDSIAGSIQNQSELPIDLNLFFNASEDQKAKPVEVVHTWLGHNENGGSYVLHTINITSSSIAQNLVAQDGDQSVGLLKDVAGEPIETNNDLSLIFDTLEKGIFSVRIIKSRFQFIAANKAFLNFINMSEHAVIGALIDQINLPAPLTNAADHFKKCVISRKSVSWEQFLPAQAQTVSITITPVFDAGGKCDHIVGSIRLFNNSKLEADRLLSDKRYTYATMATSDAIWDWDLETNVVSWGDGFSRIFNWDTCNLCSDISHWIELIHVDDRVRVESKLNCVLESLENKWFDEYRFAKPNNDFAIVLDRGFVVRDETGKPIRMVGAMQDITEQRRKEHELKLFGSVVTQTSELVMITEAEPIENEGRKIIYVNDAFCKLTGYNAQELIGKTPKILHGENTNRKEVERLRKTLKKWESCEVCLINYKKNGEEFWNNFTANPIANEKGTFTHCISIGRDLSASINAQRLDRLMSSVNQIFNTSCSLTKAIEQTTRLLGRWGKYNYSEIWMLEHDELHLSLAAMHTSAFEIEVTDDDASYGNRIKIVRSQGFAGEVWDAKKVITKSVLQSSGNCVSENGALEAASNIILGIPLIYSRKLIGVLVLGSKQLNVQSGFGVLSERFGYHLAAEIQRKQLEEELSQVFNFVPDIIAISDFDGYFKKVNPAATSLLGFSAEELIGKPFTDFLHPQDKARALVRMESTDFKNPNIVVEERYLTKSGEFKWFALTAHAIEDTGLVFSVARDITDKKNLEDLLIKSNRLAKLGSWEIDVLTRKVYWSDITKEIREAEPDYEPDLKTGIAYFKHKEDQKKIHNKVDECIVAGLPWDEELEVLTQKGNSKWVRSIGQAEMVDGKCVRIFGSFQDIDQRKRAEIEAKITLRNLEESEKRYSDLFHLSPNPMWVYHYDTLRFLDVNEMALAHYGYSYEEFLRLTLYDIRQEKEFSALESAVEHNADEDFCLHKGLFKHQKKNGEIIDVEIKSNLIDFKGQKAKLVLINDVTDRQKYINTLRKQNKLLGEIAWVQSHVVRAPLSKLMGLVDLLEKHSFNNTEMQTNLVKKIEYCANELDEVIREVTAKSEYQAKLNKL